MTKDEAFMREAYASTVPPGTPLPFDAMRNITRKGKRYTAQVEMFDGLPAVLQIKRDHIMCFEWLELEGGDICFEDGRWVRVVRGEPQP